MIYYHYTSKEAYDQIRTTEQFLPSYFSQAMDAKYGPGWYFTDLKPSEADHTLYQLWGGREVEKIKYYIECEINPELLESCRLHVYKLAPHRIDGVHIHTKSRYTNSQNTVVLFIKRMGSRLLDFLLGS